MFKRQNSLKINQERFLRLGDVTSAMCEEGMTKCGLIFVRKFSVKLEYQPPTKSTRFVDSSPDFVAMLVGTGIDYTMSNKVQGEKTFDGKSLHEISDDCLNPYQEVICILGETLQPLDADGLIPAYRFGDYETKGETVLSMKDYGSCVGFREVLQTYNKITPTLKLFRPTNFAPLIHKAIDIVKATKKYHILVIAADGQVNSEEETIQAVVDASEYPLSIICIGVGDGPWGMMKQFDEKLPKRNFDNFQFVNFYEVMCHARNRQTAFALHALMEIPDQYHAIQELGLLEKLADEDN